MTPAIDAHVHLDTHPTHPSAVQAVLTGTQARVALMALEAVDWSVAATNLLVLARIDHEEPYWAHDAAKHLTAEGITVEITPRLQEAIDEEWTWPNYPMPWCTRSEIREISDQAQKIHDAIRHGHLLVHAHARDGHTTVAVGTYLHRGGKSIYLHGEDHLRQVADTFDSPAEALVAFEKVHAAEMRPGPAPLTDTERAAIAARSVFDVTTAKSVPSRPKPETVPVHLADADDHDALLDRFLKTHGEFEKWRTWSDGTPTPPAERDEPRTELVPAYAAHPGNHEAMLDAFLDEEDDWQKYRTWVENTTIATHESLTLRIEFVHEAHVNDVAWTIAAYESPTGPRVWHLTATSATPAGIMEVLLDGLAAQDAWAQEADALNEQTVAQAMRPLADECWSQTVDSHSIRWSEPTGKPAGAAFDAFAATTRTDSPPPTWTIWGGNHRDHPTWAIHCSPHTPTKLLADLTYDLIHGAVRQQVSPPAPAQSPHHATPATAPTPAAPPHPHTRHSR